MNNNNKFLVQLNGMEKNTLDNIFNILAKLDLKYDTFHTISKEKTITNMDKFLSEDFNYITIGGVSFLRMLNNFDKSLKNSVDYSIKHFDQKYYKDLKLPLLNSGANYYSFEEIKNNRFKKDMFVKPSKDIKSFNGGVLMENETLIEYCARTKADINKVINEDIIISDIKKIFYEYRFFMYKEEILSCSRYSHNHQYSPSSFVPEYMKEKAIEYSKLYTPQDIFVLDLAETDNDISIVEYQCWNISAFYDSNLFNLLGRINEIKI